MDWYIREIGLPKVVIFPGIYSIMPPIKFARQQTQTFQPHKQPWGVMFFVGGGSKKDPTRCRSLATNRRRHSWYLYAFIWDRSWQLVHFSTSSGYFFSKTSVIALNLWWGVLCERARWSISKRVCQNPTCMRICSFGRANAQISVQLSLIGS